MNFSSIEKKLRTGKPTPLVVCMPEDAESVLATKEATDQGYVDCFFVGNIEKMKAVIAASAPGYAPKMVSAKTEQEAGARSVELIRKGEAKALMKGQISTPILLKAILNSETGIKKSSVLSHALVFEWEGRFKILTDGGMVPHPTLFEKQEILTNAVSLMQKLGIDQPKVAVLSAVETVSLKMQSTLDAAVLAKMGERKQLGKCIVDGPLALDNAISLESAHHKGLFNEVVGAADILIAPDIDTGNILGKTLIYFANIPSGGLIIGAQAPVVMLSRSDSKEIRLNSIMLGLVAGF